MEQISGQPRRKLTPATQDTAANVPSIDLAEDPYFKHLAEFYPDVPEEYRPKWQQSDHSRINCDEHTQKMEYIAAALEKAADACRKLAVQSGTGSPRKITAATNTLLHAVHETEEVIIGLKYTYPQRHSSFYELASRIPEIAETVPKLLLCNDSEFILWMPYLPSKKRTPHDIIFHEAQDLLTFHSNLPRLKKWHCDFVHCYPHDGAEGVMDVDNYYYKPMIDIIARAMFARDSYDNFSVSLFNCPATEVKKGFYIHVYERAEKVRFLSDFTDRIKNLIDR